MKHAYLILSIIGWTWSGIVAAFLIFTLRRGPRRFI
jgi:hypothetical protein